MSPEDHGRAVEAAVAANLDDLLAYAERRVLERADAADALGDALEIVWRRSRRLPADPTAARMYLFVVLRNVLRNSGRTHRRRNAAVERLRIELTVSTNAAPREPSVDVERRLDVAAAIDRLPPVQADLVRLIHWDGFTLAEAAELTGTNASTARSRYAAARGTLRGALRGASTAAVYD